MINTNRCAVLAKLKHLSLFSITQSGISSLSSCGNVQTLPELPPGEEVRLQRASKILQQKLILREWLKENRLQQYYSRYRNDSSTLLLHFNAEYFQINFDRGGGAGGCLLARGYVNQDGTYTKGFLSLLCSHLDSRASQILGKDFGAWNQARQKLPTSKAQLEILKAELWSTVVKTSNHKDAWTYGGMLVVSVSVAGLVTLGKKLMKHLGCHFH